MSGLVGRVLRDCRSPGRSSALKSAVQARSQIAPLPSRKLCHFQPRPADTLEVFQKGKIQYYTVRLALSAQIKLVGTPCLHGGAARRYTRVVSVGQVRLASGRPSGQLTTLLRHQAKSKRYPPDRRCSVGGVLSDDLYSKIWWSTLRNATVREQGDAMTAHQDVLLVCGCTQFNDQDPIKANLSHSEVGLTWCDDELVPPGANPKQSQVVLHSPRHIQPRPSRRATGCVHPLLTPSSPTALTSCPTASTILTALAAYFLATSLTDTPSSTPSSPSTPFGVGFAVS